MIARAESITLLQELVHSLQTAIFHLLVRGIAHKILMILMVKTTNIWFISNQRGCWISVKIIIVLVTPQGQIVKLEQVDIFSLKVAHNQITVVNTVTKCNNRCHIKIAHLTVANLSLDMEWIRFQVRLVESLWILIIIICPIMAFRILEQLSLLSQAHLVCMEVERGTLLELHNNNYLAIRTCNRTQQEVMLTRFTNSSF